MVGDKESNEEYFVSVFLYRNNISNSKLSDFWKKHDQNPEESNLYVLFNLNNINVYLLKFEDNTVYFKNHKLVTK